jgi:hypothetical protein
LTLWRPYSPIGYRALFRDSRGGMIDRVQCATRRPVHNYLFRPVLRCIPLLARPRSGGHGLHTAPASLAFWPAIIAIARLARALSLSVHAQATPRCRSGRRPRRSRRASPSNPSMPYRSEEEGGVQSRPISTLSLSAGKGPNVHLKPSI